MPLETGNMGGVGDLVKALTGRGAIRQQAEADAWKQADNIGRAKKAAAEAGIAEDKLDQRGGLADAILAAAPPGSMTREQAVGLATIGRGGFGNFPQLAQGQSRLFDLGQTQQAAQIATQENPDVAMMNRVLAARVSGGGRLTPNQVDPEGLAAALLAKEQAQAGSYRASADARYASANAANAQADLRNRTDPNIRVGSGGKGLASVLLQGRPPAAYVPQPGEVSLEAALAGENLPPEIMAQIGRAAESGQDFAVTVPPAGRAAPARPNFSNVRTGVTSTTGPTPESIKAQYRAGKLTREQAEAQLRKMGFD